MYAMAMAAGCCAAYSACATGQWLLLILPPCKTYEVCMYVVVQYVVVVVDVVGDGVAEAAIAGLFSAISTTILWAIGHPDFVFRSYFGRATYLHYTVHTSIAALGMAKDELLFRPRRPGAHTSQRNAPTATIPLLLVTPTLQPGLCLYSRPDIIWTSDLGVDDGRAGG